LNVVAVSEALLAVARPRAGGDDLMVGGRDPPFGVADYPKGGGDVAYTAQMAAALSGATRRQLSHWRRDTGSGALLVPEISAEHPRVLYSFRDLIALRSCVFLRKSASLQKIRKAVGTLRDLGEGEHLSQYTLASDGDTIMLLEGGDATDLVRKPGQRVLAVLSDVFEPFAVREGVVVPRLFRPRQRLEVDPETRGGVPVVSGTRVPYDVVAGLVRDGVAPENIKDYYPAVSAEAARDAADFALYVDSYGRAERAWTSHVGGAVA
jgi:uncharacterized protein (DUF433 family)